jgi:hypothetical protein
LSWALPIPVGRRIQMLLVFGGDQITNPATPPVIAHDLQEPLNVAMTFIRRGLLQDPRRAHHSS